MRVLVLVTLLMAACGGRGQPPVHFAGGEFSRGSEEHFQVAPLPPAWQRVNPSGGDLAWLEPSSNSLIAANASCRERRDQPLIVLMNDLLIGTSQRKYLLEERLPLDGGLAQHSVVTAYTGKIWLVYDLYVLEKGGCVYDLALIAQPPAYERVADEYVRWVAGFHALGKAQL